MASFASYAEKRDEELERQTKSHKPSSSGKSGTVGSKTSFEQLVNTFGSPKVKAELLQNG